jgi:hypothetical protein
MTYLHVEMPEGRKEPVSTMFIKEQGQNRKRNSYERSSSKALH